MTIEPVEQVRFRNFQWLFQQFKDEVRRSWPNEPDRGMLKKFAQRLGKNPIYLSQLNNNRKVIGTETANDIETALGLPDGWMDVDHSKEAIAADDDARAFQESVMALYTQAPEATKSALIKVFGALVTGKPLEELK
jgi:plasmid maintenance system antidote protein VapI